MTGARAFAAMLLTGALMLAACGGETATAGGKPDACSDAEAIRSKIVAEAEALDVVAPCEQPDGSSSYQHFALACEKYEEKRAQCCAQSSAHCPS